MIWKFLLDPVLLSKTQTIALERLKTTFISSTLTDIRGEVRKNTQIRSVKCSAIYSTTLHNIYWSSNTLTKCELPLMMHIDMWHYLTNVLHHKCPPLNPVQCLHPPASAVSCAKYAHFHLPTMLHNTILACRPTQTSLIALIDRCAEWHPEPLPHVVGKLWPAHSPTTTTLLCWTVRALTAYQRVLWNLNTDTCSVFIDVDKVIGRAL